MGDQQQDIRQRLADLRAAYAANLFSKVQQIEQAVAALLPEMPLEVTQTHLANIRNLTHKLAGSSGTFGFIDLGEACRDIEIRCAKLISANRPVSSAEYDEIKAATEALNKLSANQAPPPAMTAALPQEDTLSDSNKKVILVEDNPDEVKAMQIGLQSLGFEVLALGHPDKLDAAIKEFKPDAIITDVHFPEHPDLGLDFIQRLNVAGKISCPVLVTSVRNDFQARLKAKRGGADGYILKPIDFVDLTSRLNDLIHASSREPANILVVDDDDMVAQHHLEILTSAGMTGKAVNGPLEAFELLEDESFDLVLVDIEMPGCNGLELASIIRQMGAAYQYIPLVFLTAVSERQGRAEAIHEGGDDFLSKPVDPAILISTVQARVSRFRELSSMIGKLQAEESRYRAVTDIAYDAIFVASDKGVILSANKGAQEIFDYESENLVGKTLSNLFAEESQARLMQLLEAPAGEISATEAGGSFEVAAIRSDARVFPAEVSISQWQANDQKYHSISLRDITERKFAEDSLISGLERFRDFADNTGDWFWEMDGEKRFSFFSTGFQNSTKLDPEALIGKTLEEARISGLDTAAMQEQLEAFHAGKSFRDFTFLRPLVEGGEQYLSISGKAIQDASGKFLGYRGIGRDCTSEIREQQRYQDERALLQNEAASFAEKRDEQERQISFLLEHSPYAILTVRDDLRIARFNTGATTVFGYREEEVVGQKIDILIPEKYRKNHAKLVANFAALPISGGFMNQQNEIYGLRKNGEVFPAHSSISKVPTAEGNYYMVILMDIKAEKLVEQQLRQAHEKAVQADQAKSLFLANMSHELRTPLNAILGFSQIMSDDVLGPFSPEQYREYSRNILESGENLLHLITNVLELSRLQTGEMAPIAEATDLAAITRQTIDKFLPAALDKQISLTAAVEEDAPRLLADPQMLRKILENLLSNALKFTDPGGEVTAGLALNDGKEIRLFVRDTGLGMTEEEVERVLQPFTQADSSYSKRYAGAGLGLTLTREMAVMNHGNLRIESAPGKGSTFSVSFPEKLFITPSD